MLGVRQWRHVALRHGAFCVSRQLRLCRRWPGRIFMFYSWKIDVFIHRLWNNVYDRWITSNFPCKWHRTASTASGCKSSPRKIFNWNSSKERRLKFSGDGIKEDNCEAERTSVSTPKATSSTEQPETCTEAATKYYNYSVNDNEQLQANMQLTHAIFNAYYYSFKMFPRFWLAKSTRIIHHNQLLMAKFGRILCLTRKWRQKCSVHAG